MLIAEEHGVDMRDELHMLLDQFDDQDLAKALEYIRWLSDTRPRPAGVPIPPREDDWGYGERYTYKGRMFFIDAHKYLNSADEAVWTIGVFEVLELGLYEGEMTPKEFRVLQDGVAYVKERIRQALDDDEEGHMPLRLWR